MKREITIGMMGFGSRGTSLFKAVILPREEIKVAGVCDIYEDRCEEAAKLTIESGRPAPLKTTDYRDLLSLEEVDAIIISASWESHIPCAIAAMEAGKYVAMEVGGAYSIEECWQLVEAYERTGMPCMMMENCCYGRYEMLLLNMVEQGLFGELVHCKGGYFHDLRYEIAFGEENRHYRLRNYLNRNCENYPTHELGPIARLLGINHGNRMVSLSSVASKSAGLHAYIEGNPDANQALLKKRFAQGDVVNTIITCAGGETILLTLDTTLPRAYSRGLTVQGTKGMYMEDNRSFFFDGQQLEEYDFKWQEQWNNAEKYLEQYEHPLWQEYQKAGVRGGHDGMDWLVFSAFFDAVTARTQTPITVYDTAAWMSITPLSEQSISQGGAPVAIPDFTRGAWLK